MKPKSGIAVRLIATLAAAALATVMGSHRVCELTFSPVPAIE